MLAIEPGSRDCSDKELTPLHVREIQEQLTLVSFPAFACEVSHKKPGLGVPSTKDRDEYA